MPNRVSLNVIAGPIEGQNFTFDNHDTFIFGREEDCHARLSKDDKTASRHHFILEVNPPAATLCDLGSLNGTFINGIKSGGRDKSLTPEQGRLLTAESVELKNGDEIRVGQTIFAVNIQKAVYCSYCSNETDDNSESTDLNGGKLIICRNCREKRRAGLLMSTVQSNATCDKCKKNVDSEIPPGFRGHYICLNCRQAANDNPDTILEILETQLSEESAEDQADFKGYEVLKQLGEGGMGAVYLARRKSDHQLVALKTLLAQVAVSAHARALFQREIAVTKELQHPNIVKLYENGSSGSVFFFTLEYCAGGSVQDLMDQRGAVLSVKEALPIIIQALEALSFAHSHEKIFVHRDIKPQNILLSEIGGVAKLADFGLAKSFQNAGLSGMTATGQKSGTMAFMPREQLTNFKRVKPVSDVWSMAATFYYMLTGETPLDFTEKASPVEIIMRGNAIPLLERRPNLPPTLAGVIDRALNKDQQLRYQDATDFKSALEAVF